MRTTFQKSLPGHKRIGDELEGNLEAAGLLVVVAGTRKRRRSPGGDDWSKGKNSKEYPRHSKSHEVTFLA
jgi:hypothetical protein